MFNRAIRNIRSKAREVSQGDLPVTSLALFTFLPAVSLAVSMLSR
ncbi:hypothetical protein [Paraburkholderia tagetis]|nr:hypothetical protein [Paraburkholderia tagetis]